MKNIRVYIAFLLISLLIWTWFTWPLALHVHEAVPMAHAGGGNSPLRFMEPGDHLQLMYYFWLFSDMVSGQTAWMHNPYEFHTGDEADRYAPDPYYAPFSWVFTALQLISNRALAYNVTGLISLWLTVIFTWLLVRRYVAAPWIAAAAALIGILLPYRWFSLLGGSPTGLSMLWIPVLLLGLDRAVKADDKRGGILAGVALVFSYTSDLHTFLFAAMITPVWCILALLQRADFAWKERSAYTQLAIALLPTVLLGFLAGLHSLAAVGLSVEIGAQGEVDVPGSSPTLRGLIWWPELSRDSQIYFGYVMMALIAVGSAIGFRETIKSPGPQTLRTYLVLLFLVLATVIICILSVGPHGPFDSLFFRAARKIIVPYANIRQSGKIFILMPTILAVVSALSLNYIVRACPSKWARWIILLTVALMAAEYGRRNDPPICLLVEEQKAYAAVAADAAEQGQMAHALVVPLWPGDAHYASAYQYYCTLYRIRMVNGYSPVSKPDYFETIFRRYQSINQGWLTEDQADELLSRGVGYLILHADLFPEKVSPYPIAQTLHRLLEHPRLDVLQQDGPVWSFRIRASATAAHHPNTGVPASLFAARHWLLERQPTEGGSILTTLEADRGLFLRLADSGAWVLAATAETPPVTDPRWMVRVRGDASLRALVLAADAPLHESIISIKQDEWDWISIPFTTSDYQEYQLEIHLLEGTADLCSALLCAGPDIWDTGPVPAAWFFHAGYLNTETRYVHFRKGIDRSGPVFYGPKLPIGQGRFRVTLAHEADADPGTLIGYLELEQLFTPLQRPSIPIYAGEPAVLSFELDYNLPINVIFHNAGAADLALQSLSFERLAP